MPTTWRSRILAPGFEYEDIVSLANVQTGDSIRLRPLSVFRILFEDKVLDETQCEREHGGVTTTSNSWVYRSSGFKVTIIYTMKPEWHFIQKRLILKPLTDEPYLIRRIDLAEFGIEADGYTLVPFQHGQCRTYFLRGEKTGFMFGIQVPVLDDEQTDTGRIVLGYPVNYRFRPGEIYESETLFWGTYPPTGRLSPPVPRQIKECIQSERPPDIGEARAMLEMVKAQLPPAGDRVVVAVNGCQLETTLDPYDEEHAESVESDRKRFARAKDSFDSFIIQPYPTWAGADVAVSKLKLRDKRLPDMPVRKAFLEWAASEGLPVCSFVPMKGPFPWNFDGRELYTYRRDRPDWRVKNPDYTEHPYNCPASRGYMEWLTGIILDDLRRNPEIGEFMQDEAPPCPRYGLRCDSKHHDHLPGDASYGYFLARRELFRRIRHVRPDIILNGERPQMDAGIWDALYLDSLFTLSEMLEAVTSDDMRTWSRIRHFYHFVPPSMDEVPIKHLDMADPDYLMLSVLAVSRNYIVCGLPEEWAEEKAHGVRRWIRWARDHADLMRHSIFLSDWPGSGACDGYVRALDNDGYAFFFNANDEDAPAVWPLDPSSGLDDRLAYRITPEFATSPCDLPCADCASGSFEFSLPAHSAVLLRLEPATWQ